jgi:PhzF family phenazine biosynthesis protein
MSSYPMFQLDSFTKERFRGNPAAVLLLPEYPADAVLQAIAAENNLAETAFVVARGSDYQVRWFTPTVEVPLCGHATLAAAAVILQKLEPGRAKVVFDSLSGPLTVTAVDDRYVMNFPARVLTATDLPAGLNAALGARPIEVVIDSASNYVARLASAELVRDLRPDIKAIDRLPGAGVIVTAQADRDYDFVSRYFAPSKGIPEDPVTGGAHCALTPYWAERLGRTEFHAFQASARGGQLVCRLLGDRVELHGSCVFYFEGLAEIS